MMPACKKLQEAWTARMLSPLAHDAQGEWVLAFSEEVSIKQYIQQLSDQVSPLLDKEAEVLMKVIRFFESTHFCAQSSASVQDSLDAMKQCSDLDQEHGPMLQALGLHDTRQEMAAKLASDGKVSDHHSRDTQDFAQLVFEIMHAKEPLSREDNEHLTTLSRSVCVALAILKVPEFQKAIDIVERLQALCKLSDTAKKLKLQSDEVNANKKIKPDDKVFERSFQALLGRALQQSRPLIEAASFPTPAHADYLCVDWCVTHAKTPQIPFSETVQDLYTTITDMKKKTISCWSKLLQSGVKKLTEAVKAVPVDYSEDGQHKAMIDAMKASKVVEVQKATDLTLNKITMAYNNLEKQDITDIALAKELEDATLFVETWRFPIFSSLSTPPLPPSLPSPIPPLPPIPPSPLSLFPSPPLVVAVCARALVHARTPRPSGFSTKFLCLAFHPSKTNRSTSSSLDCLALLLVPVAFFFL